MRRLKRNTRSNLIGLRDELYVRDIREVECRIFDVFFQVWWCVWKKMVGNERTGG